MEPLKKRILILYYLKKTKHGCFPFIKLKKEREYTHTHTIRTLKTCSLYKFIYHTLQPK